MSLTFWNRRRREAAQAGAERSPEEVLDTLEATAGTPGTEGVEGHSGTSQTEPPLGAPEEEGSETDAEGETHEEAAGETDPQGAAADAAESAEAIASVEPEPLEKPKGNASTEAWREWALNPQGGAKTEEDLQDLDRDGIRDLFA